MSELPLAAIPFDELAMADLSVGALCMSGPTNDWGAEPITKVLRCGNQGGIRFHGQLEADAVRAVALYTTFEDLDWPDRLDPKTGRLTYFGDNKEHLRALHETSKHGNELFRRVFDLVHLSDAKRDRVPPFFVFSKASPGRSVRFHGVAAPGAEGLSETEDLVAIWKTKGSQRFQNYRAIFTLLAIDPVPRSWIDEILDGSALGPSCPEPWKRWVRQGEYHVLPGTG